MILKHEGWTNRAPSEAAAKVGRKTVLSADVEKKLIDSINALNKWGFGLSKSEILDVIKDDVTTKNIQTPFINNRPGNDWWLAFKKRHSLSIRKPEIMESSRSRQAGDPFIIMDFYNKVEITLKELNLLDKPQNIWNTDESAFPHDPKSTKVVSQKGDVAKRQFGSNGKESTIVLTCGSADRRILPAILFKNHFYYR